MSFYILCPPAFYFHFKYLSACLFISLFYVFILYFRCNNAEDCDISADSETFGGDPCPGVPKYLEVYFGCFPGKNLVLFLCTF